MLCGGVVVKRIEGRPKAADISDEAILRALEQWTDKGLPHPVDSFPELPRKVVIAKVHKAVHRGWANDKWKLTGSGRLALTAMDEAADMEATA